MSLRINDDNPDLIDVGFDSNGEFIMSYQGSPFTGIQVSHFAANPTVISGEMEYRDGYIEGLVRVYHPNGILAEEYTIGEGGFDGQYRMWDSAGMLTYDKMWVKGVMQ